MSIEITKYVKITTPSLTEPLEITVDAAIELRDALVRAFPLSPSSVESKPHIEENRWILKGTTWYKNKTHISLKMVRAVQNVVGKEWKLISDVCDILKCSRPMVMKAVNVLVQEGIMKSRGHGKTSAIRTVTKEYSPVHSEIPQVSVVNGGFDNTTLKKEEKLRREQMRRG